MEAINEAVLAEEKVPTRQIAKLFRVSKSGVRRVKQHQRERGTHEPLPNNAGRKSKLTPELEAKIRDHFKLHPDSTREELKHALGLSVALQSISRWLIKIGLVLKKSRSTPLSRIESTCSNDALSGTKS